LPKLAKQAEHKNANLENAESAVTVTVETEAKEEIAEQEKTEPKGPLRTTSAGGATTTVTGLPRVQKGKTEAGAVKETAIAKKAAASNVEARGTSNVIVEAVPSARVSDLTKSQEDAAAEEMRGKVGGDLTVTAAVPKTDTVADTADIEGADLTHPTTAEEQEGTQDAAAPPRERTVAETEDIIEPVMVELVGLHPRNHDPGLIHPIVLVRLAPDHPLGATSKKNPNVRDNPATATMKCTPPRDHAVTAEDANAAAQRNPATKETTPKRRANTKAEMARATKDPGRSNKKKALNPCRRARNWTHNNQGVSLRRSSSHPAKHSLKCKLRSSTRTTTVTTIERVPSNYTAPRHGEAQQSNTCRPQ